jgi:DNA-directed RNA polymerase specialized sigma subunit
MPEEDQDEKLAAELAALRKEESDLRERLRLLVYLHQDATRSRSQEETADLLGLRRHEVREAERRALLKLRRALLQTPTRDMP